MKRFILTSTLIAVGIFLTACGGESGLTAEIRSPSDGDVTRDLSVNFTANNSGDNVTYRWNFGDGSPEQSSTTSTISHDYAQLGTYTVTLIATKGDLESEPVSITVTVEGTPPTAMLSADPISGPAPLLVTLSSAGSSSPEGTITEEYDFGDGIRGGPGSTVRHTYEHPGTYTASVTIKDDLGQTATESVTITVGEPQQARLWEIRMDSTPDGRFLFDPPVLKINPGDTIEWVNVNDTHTSTAYVPVDSTESPLWNSNELTSVQERWSYTFPADIEQGSYAYYCAPHDFTGQVGIIIVGEFTELDPDFVNSLEGLARESMLRNLELARSL